MKKRSLLLFSLSTALALIPTAYADAIVAPGFDTPDSGTYSTAPWLLIIALILLTLLLLFKFKTKK